ncbi:MAG: hypothetical protein AB1576_01860 [Bacillota bacterium]
MLVMWIREGYRPPGYWSFLPYGGEPWRSAVLFGAVGASALLCWSCLPRKLGPIQGGFFSGLLAGGVTLLGLVQGDNRCQAAARLVTQRPWDIGFFLVCAILAALGACMAWEVTAGTFRKEPLLQERIPLGNGHFARRRIHATRVLRGAGPGNHRP